MSEIVSDARLQKALGYMVTTDEPAANAKALYIGLDEQKKTILGIAFADTQGPIEQRKSEAYSSQAYQDHLKKLQIALYEWEILRNKRLTEQMIVETWRSLNANRRKGNI